MGNCCPPVQFFRSPAANSKSVTLLLVGLDNAGKTTIAKRISEEPLDGVMPTVGFSKVSLQEKGCSVTIYDLGGGPQIRDIWPRYYADAHGIIFVIDASDIGRIDECRKALEGLLLDGYIAGKPVLLLANKQDVEGALDEIDIVDKLNVERLVNRQKCPTLVELCSARHFSRKMDIGIDNGYKWLLRCISKDYPLLNGRVLNDLATQEELDRIKRAQISERVRSRREQEVTSSTEPNHGKGKEPHLCNQENKPHQNGFVHIIDSASIPGQIEDFGREESSAESTEECVREQNTSYMHSAVSYSSQFFKLESDDSDLILISKLEDRSRIKNFLLRPKSSGARLMSNRSDKSRRRGPRRKLYHRHNKTAPSPMVDVMLEPVGSLSKMLDPIYHTEVKMLQDSGGVNQDIEVLMENSRGESLHICSSMPNSRKASATDQVSASEAGNLPLLKAVKDSARKEIILDVTALDQ